MRSGKRADRSLAADGRHRSGRPNYACRSRQRLEAVGTDCRARTSGRVRTAVDPARARRPPQPRSRRLDKGLACPVISVLTEMTERSRPALTAIQQKFILHWGEMGTRWGINRTVAQIHALLFLSPRPVHAEEIAQTLNVARSNVSTSLKELQGWRIVRVVHVLGDRRDHFESIKDVWEIFRIVSE